MNTQPWWQAACLAPDEAMSNAARARQAQLTKPAGSLGQLESLPSSWPVCSAASGPG